MSAANKKMEVRINLPPFYANVFSPCQNNHQVTKNLFHDGPCPIDEMLYRQFFPYYAHGNVHSTNAIHLNRSFSRSQALMIDFPWRGVRTNNIYIKTRFDYFFKYLFVIYKSFIFPPRWFNLISGFIIR